MPPANKNAPRSDPNAVWWRNAFYVSLGVGFLVLLILSVLIGITV